MKIDFDQRMLRVMVVAVCLSVSGCVPDGGLTPRVLEGEWILTSLDNQNVAQANSWSFEFQEDGDFQWTFFSYNETYRGEWEWNDTKDEIEIEYTDSFGDTYSLEFEVEVLDNMNLEGEIISNGYTFDVEFERDE